jgi:hypothetical protein
MPCLQNRAVLNLPGDLNAFLIAAERFKAASQHLKGSSRNVKAAAKLDFWSWRNVAQIPNERHQEALSRLRFLMRRHASSSRQVTR